MKDPAIGPNQSPSPEQKREALDEILHSQTFARADQLKSFLKYVCEMEFAGRGQELTEYLIGVEALGRPSNYSPGDDSAVRNRAFALRKKLQEYYEHEMPEASLRIELTKGSYCPHFYENRRTTEANGKAALTISSASGKLVHSGIYETPGQDTSAASIKPGWRHRWLIAFASGVILTSIISLIVFWANGKSETSETQSVISAIVAEAWSPILHSESEVIVSVANPPNFSVHPETSAESSLASPTPFRDPGGRPMPKELYQWYRSRYPATNLQNLFLTLTTNATYWGDSLAAMTVLKTIFPSGAKTHLFPEKVITMPTLRKRNVILFGAPEYSPAITHFLEKCPLNLNYLEAIFESQSGSGPVNLYSVKRNNKNSPVLTYGLITVLPSESSSHRQHRTIIFSGVNSAGTQAAAEFFTSPEHLADLKIRLQKDGHHEFPPAFQIVVRSETDDNILLNFSYETYRIIATLPN